MLRGVWQGIVSVVTWHWRRNAEERYRLQSHIVAAWVVREVRNVIGGHISTDLSWELDQFQLFLAKGIYRELLTNEGYFPISNAPLMSPTAVLYEALQEARINPPEPVIRALPHVRIRIVPGWVKVYGIGTPHAAPLTLYPKRSRR